MIIPKFRLVLFVLLCVALVVMVLMTRINLVSKVNSRKSPSGRMSASFRKPPNGSATPTARPVSCKACFPSSFEYLVENRRLCQTETSPRIDMVIIIFSAADSRVRRTTIRRTWASVSGNNTGNIRYFFAFGRYADRRRNSAVLDEHRRHGDVLQAAFGDAYVNLTYKTISSLRWVGERCAAAAHVMKTDDDMWINARAIVNLLKSENLEKSVGGLCILDAAPIRDKSSKWYASRKDYPNPKYPGFCSGTGYLMPGAVARKIVDISPDVPFFYLEDVYVSLCIRKLGYTLKNLSGFYNSKAYSVVTSNLCRYKKETLMTSHYMSASDIQVIWDAHC